MPAYNIIGTKMGAKIWYIEIRVYGRLVGAYLKASSSEYNKNTRTLGAGDYPALKE